MSRDRAREERSVDVTPIDDERDRRLATAATGVLATFNRAGVLDAADVHVATRLGRVGGEGTEEVLLAMALTVRAVRQGSVCLDLASVAGMAPDLPWPGIVGWRDLVAQSPLVRAQVLRVDDGLLYLDRYWVEEGHVCADVRRRREAAPPELDPSRLAAALADHFPGPGYDEQRDAAETTAREWTSVLTGGPGTGKTTTIARFLGALLSTSDRPLRIALAAPTGKAAARMTEALRAAVAQDDFPPRHRAELEGLAATTMHRMLGWRPGTSSRFRHDRGNRLPHDVVVIDETSMVSLTLMARLLEAMRPDARLVLVGDADQLASVDAGAVLKDLVDGLAGLEQEASRGAATADGAERGQASGAIRGSMVARLVTSHRYGTTIGDLAEAIRAGDADAAVAALTAGDDAVSLVDPGGADDLVRAAVRRLVAAADAGDPVAAVAALDAHRLLCAHRAGDAGVRHWNRKVERWVKEDLEVDWLPSSYAGQPLLVTANDYGLGLFNGDTGVVTRRAPAGPDLVARIADGGRNGGREYPLTRLADVETAHAMTVHRSQGSQFGAVTVILPPDDSPLLTRELLYTAVTRAQERVTVVGSAEAVRAAVGRRAQRASGLRGRLSRP
ncbi:MAG: exodeoxyribonuclease V subunit alpha [Lapillicoccus sp.]